MATSSMGRGQPRDSRGLATSHTRTIGRTRGDEDPQRNVPEAALGAERSSQPPLRWRQACAAALPRSAGPAGEEAGDLMGGVSLEDVAADVVAGQGGLRASGAQQALSVAQRNAWFRPTVPTVRLSACGP